MATVSSESFTVINAEARMKKGPLVKVDMGNGRYVKMYREDAIRAGHIKPDTKEKAQPKPQDKQRKPQKDKATPAPEEDKQPEQEADDFTTIDGVGPATARALAANGVLTFEQLKEADLHFLTGAALQAIEDWRDDG